MDRLERFRGPLFEPGRSGYDEERTGFNLAWPHRPALVAGATCAEDVVEAVRYAAAGGTLAAVQATGHGSRGGVQGGVLITTGRLRQLQIDPASRTARMGAGVRWGEVIVAAAEHGLAPPNGSSPGVGAVGYTLAGGLGLLGRSLGWAGDWVRALDVVTWDGRLRRATAGGEPDLFRALRGSGGAPGVVVAMEIGLVPVTTVLGGALTFDGAHAATVLDAWLAWTEVAPREVTSSLALVTMPDVPTVPAALRGRDTVSVRLACLGERSTGETLVAPLRAAAPALTDTLRVLPWSESATITSDPPLAHPYHGTGVMLGSLDRAATGAILRGAGPAAPVPTVAQLNHLGGALAEPPASPDVLGHRGAAYLLRLLSLVDSAGTGPVEQAHEAVVAGLGDRVRGRSLGFQFGAHPAAQWEACFEPADLPRLRALLPAGVAL